MTEFNDAPLVLKKRGEEGNKVISVRIKENTLAEIDKITSQSNYSRNKLINILLNYGIKNLTIEK